jgi:hypothetical protein
MTFLKFYHNREVLSLFKMSVYCLFKNFITGSSVLSLFQFNVFGDGDDGDASVLLFLQRATSELFSRHQKRLRYFSEGEFLYEDLENMSLIDYLNDPRGKLTSLFIWSNSAVKNEVHLRLRRYRSRVLNVHFETAFKPSYWWV